MMRSKEFLTALLNSVNEKSRLRALQELKDNYPIRGQVSPCWVNNHIHSVYSFSPYTPAYAAYMAYASGLSTAGIMDHDTISGAEEFIDAGKLLGLPTTIGVEARINMRGTPFESRLINNPDQKGIAYMALHGIPHGNISKVDEFFKPYREKRNIRNRLMSKKIAQFIAPYGITYDFDADVLPQTLASEGGTVTERVLCYILAVKIIEKFGKGAPVIDFLEKELNLKIGAKPKEWLTDAQNVHYVYDLLGVLKGGIVSKFYVDSDEECPFLDTFIAFGKSIGAIVAYAYLGDVAESVTGDKKAQKFEDDYLDELFAFLKAKGVNAIAYMPSRNSGAQLERLRTICAKESFFEISGEDINSSRQSFICPQLKNPEFAHLITATWALIGHEKEATKDINSGMFSAGTIKATPELKERIEKFAEFGRG